MKLLPLFALLIACGDQEVVDEAAPAEAAPAEAAPAKEVAPDPANDRLFPRVGLRLSADESGALNTRVGEGPAGVESRLEVRPAAGAEVRFLMYADPEASVFQIWDLAPEETGAEAPHLDSRLALGTISDSQDRAVDLALSALPRDTDWCVTPVGPRGFALNNEPLPVEACTPLFLKPEPTP